MTIYHVETQEDYDALMIELEKEDCKWNLGEKPTDFDNWFMFKEKTYVMEENKILTCGDIEESYLNSYSEHPLIKYKANKNDFIKELTVKIYYNEITKKHYNSYEDAIADCKKEMERQHDKN